MAVNIVFINMKVRYQVKQLEKFIVIILKIKQLGKKYSKGQHKQNTLTEPFNLRSATVTLPSGNRPARAFTKASGLWVLCQTWEQVMRRTEQPGL